RLRCAEGGRPQKNTDEHRQIPVCIAVYPGGSGKGPHWSVRGDCTVNGSRFAVTGKRLTAEAPPFAKAPTGQARVATGNWQRATVYAPPCVASHARAWAICGPYRAGGADSATNAR